MWMVGVGNAREEGELVCDILLSPEFRSISTFDGSIPAIFFNFYVAIYKT